MMHFIPFPTKHSRSSNDTRHYIGLNKSFADILISAGLIWDTGMKSTSEPRSRTFVNFKNESGSLNDVTLHGLNVHVSSSNNSVIKPADLHLYRWSSDNYDDVKSSLVRLIACIRKRGRCSVIFNRKDNKGVIISEPVYDWLADFCKEDN